MSKRPRKANSTYRPKTKGKAPTAKKKSKLTKAKINAFAQAVKAAQEKKLNRSTGGNTGSRHR